MKFIVITKKKIITIALALLFLLVLATSVYFLNQTKYIRIVIGEQRRYITTKKNTVKDILLENKVKISEYDKVMPSLKTEIKDGSKITIEKSKKITLTLKDVKETANTTEKTVESFLKKRLGLKTLNGYKINYSLSHKITSNMNLVVKQILIKNINKSEALSYKVEKKPDSNMLKGTYKVIVKGQNGKVIKYYENTYEDNKLTNTKYVSQKIVQKPINSLICYGTKLPYTTNRGGYGPALSNNSITMEATAYTASYEDTGKTSGSPDYGITATGTRAKVGTVAVDPRVIPLGTKLYIKSLDGSKDYGYATAEDTGGAIKGNRIDLYYNSEDSCNYFGRRNVRVYIVK